MILLNPKQSSHPRRKHLSVDIGNNLTGMRADDVLISARELKWYVEQHNANSLLLYLAVVFNVLTLEKHESKFPDDYGVN